MKNKFLDDFLEKYNENYDTFYEHSGESKVDKVIRNYSERFDTYTENSDGFFLFVCTIASYRGDLFVSNRECASFMKTYDYFVDAMRG